VYQSFNEAVSREQRKNLFLTQGKIRPIYEGNSFEVITEDGYSDKGVSKEIAVSKFEITRAELIAKGPEAFFSKVEQVGKDAAQKSSHEIIKKIDESTERTNNVVSAKGEKLSPKHILSALDKIAVEFDDYGNMIRPTLYVNPEIGERMKKEAPGWEKDPYMTALYNIVVAKKRQEWIDRENNRKLVE
jgi:hypothetical protein